MSPRSGVVKRKWTLDVIEEEGDRPVGRTAMCGLLGARLGPLAVSDVRRDLLAFLEGESLGCRPLKCPVRLI